jgi:predicted nucleic acid-binding protein
VDQFLAQIEQHSLKVKPQKKLELSPDPEDNKFLECALEARAGFIITGNTKHFPFGKFKKTLIVSPSEFLDYLAKLYFA